VRQRGLLAHRLQGYGTTIFAEISALAAATHSINLGLGFPDDDGPPEVIEAAVVALREGQGNQYPPGPGIPELRRAIARHQHRFYDLTYDSEREVLVTTGATEAIAAALFAMIEPGDEVIMFEPYYDSYAACISMAGGVRRLVTLEPPDFRPSLAALEQLINSRTRAVLLNSPHNPTGMVLSSTELDAIATLAIKNDLIVITDEVYEHLVYHGEHVPIATMQGMRDRTISISSAGKTFSLTGWKIGWVTGSADVVAAVRTAKQFLTYVSGGPFQYAIAHALSFSDEYFAKFRRELSRKCNFLCAGLTESGFEVYRPQGTYFIMTDIRSLGQADGVAFVKSLASRCGIVAVPTATFYNNPATGATHVRFAFCKRDEILAAAVERLKQFRSTRPS
jgi:N-succinyldiaminopimelate aminotransferase